MYNAKRLLAVLSLALTLSAPAVVSAASMDTTKPMVDYSKSDVVMKDGMELVALRPIAESLGYQVAWNAMNHSVTLTCTTMMKDGESNMTESSMDGGDMSMADMSAMDSSMTRMYTIEMMIGSKTAAVDKMKTMLMDAPIMIGNKTYVTKDFVNMYLAEHAMMMK